MTPNDAMAILAHMNELRDKIRLLVAERDFAKRLAGTWADQVADVRAQLADITAERDALAVELDEALCINDQQQEAAEARRYGRSLP